MTVSSAGKGLSSIARHRLFWPSAALVLLLVSNLFFSSDFFNIRLQDGHLYGSLIDIVRFGTAQKHTLELRIDFIARAPGAWGKWAEGGAGIA